MPARVWHYEMGWRAQEVAKSIEKMRGWHARMTNATRQRRHNWLSRNLCRGAERKRRNHSMLASTGDVERDIYSSRMNDLAEQRRMEEFAEEHPEESVLGHVPLDLDLGVLARPPYSWEAVPSYNPASPSYSPTSPMHNFTSPSYSPTTPHRPSPTSPWYSPTTPMHNPTSPSGPELIGPLTYSPTSPAYPPTDPSYVIREAPNGAAASLRAPEWVHERLHGPARAPRALPPIEPASPLYTPVAPTYQPTSPLYRPDAETAAAREAAQEERRRTALAAFPNDLVAQARARREKRRAAKTADAPAKAKDPEETVESADQCLICQDAVRTHLCAPCGHLTMCGDCADKHLHAFHDTEPHPRCPYCREDCVFVVQLRKP